MTPPLISTRSSAFSWKVVSGAPSSPTATSATSSSTASPPRSSLYNQHHHPQRRPRVHPVGDVHRQIDAAVTHRRAKVVVPVGAMQRMAAVGEIHHIRHFRYIVGLAADDAGHVLLGRLGVDGEKPGRRAELLLAGADIGTAHHGPVFIGPQRLLAERDDDRAATSWRGWRRVPGGNRHRRHEERLVVGGNGALRPWRHRDVVTGSEMLADRRHRDVLAFAPAELPALESLVADAVREVLLAQWVAQVCRLTRRLPECAEPGPNTVPRLRDEPVDRKSTRLHSSHTVISYAVFCLKKKKASLLVCQRACRGNPLSALQLATHGHGVHVGFFFDDAASRESYTRSLPAALPI